jgi:hypothetical protein
MNLSDVPLEVKLAILIRLAELIEEVKDRETLGGLRMVFSSLIQDLSFSKSH